MNIPSCFPPEAGYELVMLVRADVSRDAWFGGNADKTLKDRLFTGDPKEIHVAIPEKLMHTVLGSSAARER